MEERKNIVYKHPDLKPILQESQGVLIYQEQIMAISRVIGGFTAAEADDLRKAMGKKIVEKMKLNSHRIALLCVYSFSIVMTAVGLARKIWAA